MKETMEEIIDEIADQELDLLSQGFRAGFILAGNGQFRILMRLCKKGLMSNMQRSDLDGSNMLSGFLIVIDSESEDRFEVVPESSIRTDSIMRQRKEKKDHGE